MTKSRGILAPRRYWTKRELGIVRRMYAGHSTKQIAKLIRRSVLSVYQCANKQGLQKDEAYLARKKRREAAVLRTAGVNFRFQKGQVPHNKGLRRPGWYRGRMRETQFKKGARPHTWKPVGTLRINGDGYLDQKVTDKPPVWKHWVSVHRLVWKQAGRRIPKNHVVVFKPGRHTTELEKITLDALECISRKALMLRNSFHYTWPKELKELIYLRAAVRRQINRRVQREEQNQRSARPSVRDARSVEGQGKAHGHRARQRHRQRRRRDRAFRQGGSRSA